MSEGLAQLRAAHRDQPVARAAGLLALYRESGGRWRFVLITLQAALWIGEIQRLTRWLGRLLPRDLHALVDDAAEINRAVALALHAGFLGEPLPERPPSALLARVRGSQPLDEAAHLEIFEQTLLWEQHGPVAARFEPALAALQSPLARFVAARAILPLRLGGLPHLLGYRDFRDPAARIETTLRAYRLATASGWNRVEAHSARLVVRAGDRTR